MIVGQSKELLLEAERERDAYQAAIVTVKAAADELQKTLHTRHPDEDVVRCLRKLEIKLGGYQAKVKRIQILGR